MPKSGGVRRQLVELVDVAVGPRHEQPPVGQHGRRAVAADRRGDSSPVGTSGVSDRVRARRSSPRRRASGRRRSRASMLHERAGLDRVLALGGDAEEDVARRWTRSPARASCRACRAGRDRDHLRAVRVHREQLHVVDVLEVLPAREADAPVLHAETASRVCDRFCEQSLRSASPPPSVIVASCVTTRAWLYSSARVPISRVGLVRHERDALAGRADGVDVVVRAEGELMDLVTRRPRGSRLAQ